MSRISEFIHQLVESHFDLAQLDDLAWLEALDDDELDFFIASLGELAASIPTTALARLLHRLIIGQRDQATASLGTAAISWLGQLYSSRDSNCPARHLALAILNTDGSEAAVHEAVELIVSDPLHDSNEVAVALAPFFHNRRAYAVDELFPRLFDGLDNLAAAPPILDLANFLFREELVDQHPAEERKEELLAFFGGLIQRLGVLQEQAEPASAAESQTYRSQVQESISLAVSMCDTFALLEYEQSVGKLYQALDLRHRRLRTEAAAALATLGEDSGTEVLIELAAEPIARLRVLQYCDELGIEDQVPDEFCSEEARAESELALWLSQPAQFGIPPMSCELIDQRTLYWPGYDELVKCFLFRYEYQFQDGNYSNIAIAGPLTRSLAADLSDVSVEDIYSVFAGYDAEHEEMVEQDVLELSELQLAEVSRLERRVRDHGYYDVEPLRFGTFFGEKYLVAKAKSEGAAGLVITDSNELILCPTRAESDRSLGPSEAAFLYRGRKLIRSFNA